MRVQIGSKMASTNSKPLGISILFLVLSLQYSLVGAQNRHKHFKRCKDCKLGKKEHISDVKYASWKLQSIVRRRTYHQSAILPYNNGTSTFQLERIKLIGTIRPNPDPGRNLQTVDSQTAAQQNSHVNIETNRSRHYGSEGRQHNKNKLSIFYANA